MTALSRKRRSPAQAAMTRSISSEPRKLGTDVSRQLAKLGTAYSRPGRQRPVATRKRRNARVATAIDFARAKLWSRARSRTNARIASTVKASGSSPSVARSPTRVA